MDLNPLASSLESINLKGCGHVLGIGFGLFVEWFGSFNATKLDEFGLLDLGEVPNSLAFASLLGAKGSRCFYQGSKGGLAGLLPWKGLVYKMMNHHKCYILVFLGNFLEN